MRRLFSYARRYWLRYVFGILCTFANATLAMIIPLFIRDAINATDKHRPDLVAHYAGLMIAVRADARDGALVLALRHLQRRPRHRIRPAQRPVRASDHARHRLLHEVQDRRPDVAHDQRPERGANDGRDVRDVGLEHAADVHARAGFHEFAQPAPDAVRDHPLHRFVRRHPLADARDDDAQPESAGGAGLDRLEGAGEPGRHCGRESLHARGTRGRAVPQNQRFVQRAGTRAGPHPRRDDADDSRRVGAARR